MEPISDEETPIYTQLRKEYQAVEQFELFFGMHSPYITHSREAF